MDFVLTPSGEYKIVGRVLDAETERPLTDFELLWDMWPKTWETPHLYSGNTYRFKAYSAADGRFQLHVRLDRTTQEIDLLLLARAKNYSTAIETLDLESLGGDEEIVVYLRPGGRVSGVVTDESANPVTDVEIYYQHAARIKEISYDRVVARTDVDGHFTIENFPQAPQRIVFYHPNYANRVIHIPEPLARSVPLEVVLTAGGTVKGTVAPIPKDKSTRVRISVSDNKWNLKREDVDEDGSYLLEHVTPQDGKAKLSISYDNDRARISYRYSIFEKPVTVEDGKTTQIDFTLEKHTSVIEGQIQLADALLPSYIQVQAVYRTDQTTETHSVHANPDGTYRLDSLPAGKAELHATLVDQSNGEHTLGQKTVEIGEGQVLKQNFHVTE